MFCYIIIYSQLQEYKKMWSDEDLTLADEQYNRDIDKLMEDGLYNKHKEIINQSFSDENKDE